MDNKTRFAGVVVLYLPTHDVIENILSYVKSIEKLYVVDNTDKTIDGYTDVITKIKEITNVEYIAFPENPGIAKALNVAFLRAKEERFSWIISLDQDSRFQSNILEEYQKRINSKPHNNNVAVYTPEYVFDRSNKAPLLQDKQVKFTMQSASLFNLAIFDKIGPFREDFFLDCVDYDYCCKVQKNNLSIIQCAGAKLNHNPGITKNKNFFLFDYKYGYMPPIRLYYQIRNLLQLSKEYKSFFLLALVMWKIFKVVFFFETKKDHFNAVLKGFKDFQKKRFGKT